MRTEKEIKYCGLTDPFNYIILVIWILIGLFVTLMLLSGKFL